MIDPLAVVLALAAGEIEVAAFPPGTTFEQSRERICSSWQKLTVKPNAEHRVSLELCP